MATLTQRIKNVLRPFKRIRKEIGAMKSEIAEAVKAERFDNIAQTIAFERFYHNQTMTDCQSIDFSKNNFVLFDYPYHSVYDTNNLGDYIQSIATKNAIDSIFTNANYEYFSIEYLAYYNEMSLHKYVGGGGICKLQWKNRCYARLV